MAESTGSTVAKETLKDAIVSFLRDYSIEATPHDAGKLDSFKEVLAPGTAVYVAHPPGVELDVIVELAARIQKMGYKAVPHLISRKMSSVAQLERALATLQEAGVDHALVLGGDIAVENAAFDSSLELLETGLLEKHGFRKVGVAGHPEGSKAIGEERVKQALEGKAAFAKRAPFEMRIVTQFGFDPDAFTSWEAETTAAGVTLPVHVGFPGPTSLKQLMRFAALCGIGSSTRMLMNRTGAMANLLRTQAPDEMITHIARHRLSHPASRLVKAHFFCFGGVVKTARWANSVIAGQFELNAEATGFEVKS
ncbi:MAG TPA: methylenetetrahydrofolate reductase [Gammaproteobacteria bacterium]